MFLPQQSHVQRMQTATMLLASHSMSSPQESPSSPSSDTPTRMPLKFGMDRILSQDLSPRRRTHSGSQSSSPLRSPQRLNDDHSGRMCSEGGGVPCSECVSSLLRCCSVSATTPLAPTPTYAFYPSLHHLTPAHHAAPPPHFTSMFSTEASHLLHPHASKPSVPTSNASSTPSAAGGKRKRSWSRAVFSNLQRKGLEKRFQLQKYITKPDRRQLAATLGLTDAQVKVWFQNRRMKWRHSKEAKQQQQTVAVQPADSRGPSSPNAVHIEDVDAARRAADSTQLSNDMKTDDESDVDIEVDS